MPRGPCSAKVGSKTLSTPAGRRYETCRARLGRDDDGRALVDAIGAAESDPQLNLTANSTRSQRSQPDGVVHILRRLVAYARNPSAHSSDGPFDGDWWTALHVLTMMSLVAVHLEGSGSPADVSGAVHILTQPDVPLDDRAIAAAVTRAGRNQYEPLMVAILRREQMGRGVNAPIEVQAACSCPPR
jgi:hypothetical protein